MSTVLEGLIRRANNLEHWAGGGYDYVAEFWPDDPEAVELIHAMIAYGFIGRFEVESDGNLAYHLSAYGNTDQLLYNDEYHRAFMDGAFAGWIRQIKDKAKDAEEECA